MIRRLFHWKDKTNIDSEVWKVFAKLRAGESSLSVHKRLTMMTKMMTKTDDKNIFNFSLEIHAFLRWQNYVGPFCQAFGQAFCQAFGQAFWQAFCQSIRPWTLARPTEPDWLAGRLAGWLLAGWLWLAGWLAGWLGPQTSDFIYIHLNK